MKEDNWIGFILILVVTYTVIMLFVIEKTSIIVGIQINFSFIIGILLVIVIKIRKK
ncbi:hypothetical protein SAMN05216389_10813 [Oceanobacillus limi]|uniref:Uncharacterized protein n=1 Tax=Oceanobacillus limi TaxID=930131 RepID=A0A1I0D5R3_9BACI|nr:hypothetical protein [Oceanobacillus limi]SET27258.1 hypothetical protein SAMN05216389_10813 [Oceanobacillus limi]